MMMMIVMMRRMMMMIVLMRRRMMSFSLLVPKLAQYQVVAQRMRYVVTTESSSICSSRLDTSSFSKLVLSYIPGTTRALQLLSNLFPLQIENRSIVVGGD